MAAPKIGPVTPPPMKRGGRKSTVPTEIVDAFRTGLVERDDDGKPVMISDNVTYEKKDDATAMVMRLKKALVNHPDTEYGELKAIKSRVWNVTEEDDDSDKARWQFALTERV